MTTLPNRVKDLFDLPESVHKIGFVEELARAVLHPKVTAETYVVTPGLVTAFDKALELVGAALRDGRSRAAYLQGKLRDALLQVLERKLARSGRQAATRGPWL
jgi:hypothetical protein